MRPLLLAALFLFVAEPAVRVEGDVDHKLSLTAADLRARFGAEIREVTFTEKGVAGHAHAFPLLSLVNAAAPKANPRRKHAPLAFAVVAEGEDGYAATFGMGDLTPDLGHAVWVALDWNDKPLAPEDGPVRLIVPGDAKPARWVHAVRTLRLVDLAPRKVKPAEKDQGVAAKP